MTESVFLSVIASVILLLAIVFSCYQDVKRSRKTDKVIRDIRNARRNCKHFKNIEDLFEDLDK